MGGLSDNNVDQRRILAHQKMIWEYPNGWIELGSELKIDYFLCLNSSFMFIMSILIQRISKERQS